MKEKTLDKNHMRIELLACLEEQCYPGILNKAGLVLIGLFELEGKFINKIIKNERKNIKFKR